MKLQVGVKALVERDGKYLFIRRPVGFDAGFQNWDIPGGRIEDDEPLRKALAREIKEEVSLAFGGGATRRCTRYFRTGEGPSCREAYVHW